MHSNTQADRECASNSDGARHAIRRHDDLTGPLPWKLPEVPWRDARKKAWAAKIDHDTFRRDRCIDLKKFVTIGRESPPSGGIHERGITWTDVALGHTGITGTPSIDANSGWRARDTAAALYAPAESLIPPVE